MGYFSSAPTTQPTLADRRDYQAEAKRLAATGMQPRDIAAQLNLTRRGVIELLDDSALRRQP
jgi:hypothetical protein